MEQCASDFGGIHIAVNNAGNVRDKSFLKMSDEDFMGVVKVHVHGTFMVSQEAALRMKDQGTGGSIVNTASFVAVMGAATPQIAYTASKGGVLAMTREVAVRYARQGIRANALCPGPVNTPLLEELLADPAARARRLVHVPMGRLAEAHEVARAALFLASKEAGYITGQTITVDGGQIIPESIEALEEA